MVSYLMIGSNINASKIINTFANSGVNYKTYDGTKAEIDCAILDLPNNSNVVIYSHGKIYNDLHILFLCTSLVTKNSFEEISKNKALNIELFCCYSGTAINDLPKNSKLITLTASDHPLIEDFRDELSINALKLNYYNNFFIKFASYLFMNPETNKFAINSNRLGNSVFVSDINSLVEFTWKLKDIKKWQRGQLENFINFCKKIKHDQKQSDSNDITQLIKLYEDDELLSNWLSQFNLKRYQEIFFISMSYYANLKVMKNLLKIDVDINAKTNTNNTALHIALQKGHKDVVVGLLNDGVDINIKNSDG